MPTVGTNKNNVILELILKGFSPGREDCIDTSHLIAHFPAGLKNKVGKQLLFIHTIYYIACKVNIKMVKTQLKPVKNQNSMQIN